MAVKNFTDISFLIWDLQQSQEQSHQNDRVGTLSYGSSKEHEPMPVGVEQAPRAELHEVIEHKPDEDVQEFVESRSETIDLPDDVKELGGQSTGQAVFTAQQKVELPISDEQVMEGLHAPITSSLRWLAEYCIYLLKRAHLQLKEAHGKAVRVLYE